VQTQAAQAALEKARLELGESKRDIASKTAMIDFIAKTPNIADPDALDALRKANPTAWTAVRKHVEDMREASAKAAKEERAATTQMFDLTKKSLNFIEPLLPSIRDQNSYTAVRNYALLHGDKNLSSVIGPEFTPENVLRLKNVASSTSNMETKELPDGRYIVINKGTGTYSFLTPEGMQPGGKLSDLQGGASATTTAAAPPVAPVAPTPGMAPGITASMNATNAMPQVQAPAQAPTNAMVQPPVDPLMAIKAQANVRALQQKEAEAAATARGQAAGKTTAEELALTPQIETAVKNIQDAIKPGGLLDKATGSGIGNIIDKSLGFLGVATGGSVATAQLQPIADMALKLVPRFEGPQSDADRQSYVDAAGALADATKPIEARRAAAQTIVRLMQERRDQFGVNKGQAGEGIPGERRGAAKAGPVAVQIPGGKSFTFPDQAAADKFRKEAGL
jgi:hypothetical protein